MQLRQRGELLTVGDLRDLLLSRKAAMADQRMTSLGSNGRAAAGRRVDSHTWPD